MYRGMSQIQANHLKVLSVSFSDYSGGASRAAYRIHKALTKQNVDSFMKVTSSRMSDDSVSGAKSRWQSLYGLMRKELIHVGTDLLFSSKYNCSPAVLPSGWHSYLNDSDADIIHLHWINNEMISIADLGKIEKPIVWTFHDMWPFCGAEHYTRSNRWMEGYNNGNRPESEKGFDVNKWTWQRKKRYWNHRQMHIVTPSRWLGDCVRMSSLMKHIPVTVIHDAIDTEYWVTEKKPESRAILNLPKNAKLILFGATLGTKDPRKGYDLLNKALFKIYEQFPQLELVVFGEDQPLNQMKVNIPVHFTGHIADDLTLKRYYSAADLFVIPSRQEVLGLTGLEAMSCSKPLVGFDQTGVTELIDHKENGYLADYSDADDLANGIEWILNHNQREELGKRSRLKAVEEFSYPVIANQYIKLYQSVLSCLSSINLGKRN